MADYGKKVILSPKGSARKEVPIGEINIPDLWHIAMAYPENSREREAILETWHLAHDLKRNLAGDVD
jgi:hypothetical protein